MKKTIALIISIFILSFIHGASVWEGAAGIASNSDFPTQGNYILSNAFPKHTVVEITNLENGITIQAEVTGPLGTSGVLAAVSPEAAKNLSLRSGSVSRVRVRIPFTSAENLVFDNSFQNNDPDVNPQAAIAFDKARYGETEVSEDEEWLGYVPEQVFTDEMVAQEDSGEGTQGVGPEENIVPEEVITASEEAIENKKAMEMDSVAEETVIDDAVAESTGSDESSTEESGETEIEATKGSSEIRDEKTESVEVVLIPPEEIETEDEDEIIVLSDDSLVPETPETSELPDAEKVADDLIISDEPELVVSFDDSQIEINRENQPVLPDSEVVAETDIDSDFIAKEEDIIIPETPVIADESTVKGNIDEYVSETPDTLEKGIYIQIAALQDSKTLDEVCGKYGEDYPIKLVGLQNNGKNLVRVLIGPVNRDEYGAVLERFKSFGFKDAFVSRN